MSKWAQKRKRNILIVIGILILIVLFFVISSARNKEPTCFDGVQNGTETGIDCGGSCARVCKDEARNIVVWWERPFKVAKGVYNLVAYFENQNINSGIRKLTYEFRVYDKNNILVAKPRVGETFIEPNKRSAIFEPGVKTGDNEAYTVFFKILKASDWEKTHPSFSYSLFNVGEPVLSQQDTAPKLIATVENTSVYNFTDVPVIAILYNQKGNAIAASRTYIDVLNAGDSKKVFYSWPEAFSDVVSRVEIIPRINPFVSIEDLKS